MILINPSDDCIFENFACAISDAEGNFYLYNDSSAYLAHDQLAEMLIETRVAKLPYGNIYHFTDRVVLWRWYNQVFALSELYDSIFATAKKEELEQMNALFEAVKAKNPGLPLVCKPIPLE